MTDKKRGRGRPKKNQVKKKEYYDISTGEVVEVAEQEPKEEPIPEVENIVPDFDLSITGGNGSYNISLKGELGLAASHIGKAFLNEEKFRNLIIQSLREAARHRINIVTNEINNLAKL